MSPDRLLAVVAVLDERFPGATSGTRILAATEVLSALEEVDR